MKPFSKKGGFSYSIGVYPTLELLKYRPEKVTKVYYSPKGKTNSGLSKIKEICLSRGIVFEEAGRVVIRISNSENCYAVGVFDKYRADLEKGNHLVLVNPSDSGNLGTILRTCLAFGINNVAIIKPAVDYFDPKVVRASMGGVFGVNITYFESLKEYQEKFKNNLYLFTSDARKSVREATFQTPFSLVFGNEGFGINKNDQRLGECVTIPQSKEVDSLNLAVAVGIGLYLVYNTLSVTH